MAPDAKFRNWFRADKATPNQNSRANSEKYPTAPSTGPDAVNSVKSIPAHYTQAGCEGRGRTLLRYKDYGQSRP